MRNGRLAMSMAIRVALITGATQGIGRAIAMALAEAVVPASPCSPTPQKTSMQSLLKSTAGEEPPLPIVADVTSERDVEQAFRTGHERVLRV